MKADSSHKWPYKYAANWLKRLMALLSSLDVKGGADATLGRWLTALFVRELSQNRINRAQLALPAEINRLRSQVSATAHPVGIT